MIHFYILDDKHKPIAMNAEDNIDLTYYGRWMAILSNRRVAESTYNGCWVSTVFLGVDHNFADHGKPILFETMIFTKRKGSYKKINEYQWRYRTWDEAETGHQRISKLVKHKDITQLAH